MEREHTVRGAVLEVGRAILNAVAVHPLASHGDNFPDHIPETPEEE